MYASLSRFFGAAHLDAITPLRVEAFQLQRIRKSPRSTVIRECALLKHMFNVAERWDLYQGRNPVKFVRFLPEKQSSLPDPERGTGEGAPWCCPSYLQDMIVLPLTPGCAQAMF
jgi:hypothetical protein